MNATVDLVALFKEAEADHIRSNSFAAIKKYWYVSKNTADPQLHITAEHRLALVYMILNRPVEADAVLEELLDSDQIPTGSELRGYILRDQAMALHQLGDNESAIATAEEAICVFRNLGSEGTSGLAISLGYLSRFLGAAGEGSRAVAVAEEASFHFVQIDDPRSKFYYDCWYAALLALTAKPEPACRLANLLLGKQDLFVNNWDRTWLKLVIEHADDPNSLRTALHELNRS